MSLDDVLYERREVMHRFVTHVQVLAGQLNELPPFELLERFDELAMAVPRLASRIEQLAIETLLYKAAYQLAHLLESEECVRRYEVFDQQAFTEVIGRLRALQSSPRIEAHLSEFTQLIARRYNETDLSVTAVAAEMRLSRCYLTRILKRNTGHGFRWNLHTQRIGRAKELLSESTLTVKEIAACVGYVRTSQFDRCFSAFVGSTPSEYRGAHSRNQYYQRVVA